MEVVQMKYHPKEVYYEHRNGVSYIVLVYGDSKVEHVISAQQSVQADYLQRMFMEYRELLEKFIETEIDYGNIINREGVTVGLLRKFVVFLEGSAAEQSVQRIGFKRPLVARSGYFLIRKGWWLVGYANR